MSRLMCFSVYDSKLEAYVQPFFAPTAPDAIRSFTDAANDQGHAFNKHSEDYSLWIVGTFDQHEGSLMGQEKTLICNAFDVHSEDYSVMEQNPGILPRPSQIRKSRDAV